MPTPQTSCATWVSGRSFTERLMFLGSRPVFTNAFLSSGRKAPYARMRSFPRGHTEVIVHSPNRLRAAFVGMSSHGGIATRLSDRDVILFRFPVNRAGMRVRERPAGMYLGDSRFGPSPENSLHHFRALSAHSVARRCGWLGVGWSSGSGGWVGLCVMRVAARDATVATRP